MSGGSETPAHGRDFIRLAVLVSGRMSRICERGGPVYGCLGCLSFPGASFPVSISINRRRER